MKKLIPLFLVAIVSFLIVGCNDDESYLNNPFNYWSSDATQGAPKAFRAGTEGAVINNMTVPGPSPTGVTWDYDYLWVSDYSSSNIVGIDPDSGEIKATIPSPHPHPTGIERDFRPPTHKNLWVITEACPPSNKAHLTLISSIDGSLETEYELPYPNPLGLGYGNSRLLLTYADSPIIHFIDDQNGNETKTLNTGVNNMRGIDKNNWTGRIWVIDGDNNKLIELDYTTGEHLRSISPPFGNCWGLEVDR